jgi:hypothetical protein
MAGLVARWVRFYTRDLPAAVARRRSEEIDADLHDQVAHERADGTGDRRIALTVASRMIRGLAADVAWRGRQARQARHSTLEEPMKTSKALYRSAARVALGVALILRCPSSECSSATMWSGVSRTSSPPRSSWRSSASRSSWR